jgi:hypothetical protein
MNWYFTRGADDAGLQSRVFTKVSKRDRLARVIGETEVGAQDAGRAVSVLVSEVQGDADGSE